MSRRPEERQKHCTKPDHRPMLPEFRMPGDNLDTVVREVRRRYEDVNPEHKIKWR